MRRIACVIGLCGVGGWAAAQETVTVPWTEFRALYRESLERELRKTLPERPAEPVISLDEASYRFALGLDGAAADVTLTGRVIAGRPDAVPLFGPDVVVARVGRTEGGSLLMTEPEGVPTLSFLSDGKPAFRAEFRILLPVREDKRSRQVALRLPAAVGSVFKVEPPPGHRLVGVPGIPDGDGGYHVASGGTLELRFEAARAQPEPSPVEIDTFTQVRVQGRRVALTTSFLPAHPAAAPFRVRLPEGFRLQSSSLKSSWVRDAGAGLLEITLPPDLAEPFTVACVREEEWQEGSVAFALPRVEGNAGREGDFLVEEPEDARLTVAGTGLLAHLPVARLPAGFRLLAGREESHLRVPPGGKVELAIRRLEAVGTPEVVLDAMHFFTSFAEGGGALSVLRLELPMSAGPRLQLRSVPGAEIWSLKVNGERKEVYTLEPGTWVIPLARDGPSRVELAWLRQGAKLGLQGRLEAALPATGLPVRNVFVGLALPPRVQLASLEGDLAPAAGEAWPMPDEFQGQRHFFARAFYKGEGLQVALFYKEPVDARAAGATPAASSR